jgi:hypothetical protein
LSFFEQTLAAAKEALAIINTVGVIVSMAVAVDGAKAGYGYWSLVAITVILPLANTIGC